jgi:RimJ/RimL family protein N-acetyltransferase
MGQVAELGTERLLLRQWREEDLEPFAALSADPEVMRYFPSTQTREQSDALARDFAHRIEQQGWGFWAVEVRGGPAFIGFVGLNRPSFDAHFTPALETGWRLAREHWDHGYATEAARAAVRFGFGELEVGEIVAFTAPANARSRRVMERLGMKHDPSDDFDHPRVPPGPIQRHVLYRLARPEEGFGEPGRENDGSRR